MGKSKIEFTRHALIAAALSAIATVTSTQFMPTQAQPIGELKYFRSSFYHKNHPPDCKIFYPVPVGAVPSYKAKDDTCLPPPLAIIPGYGKAYTRLMKIGIRAGIRGDYNTALINFRRAQQIEISKDYLGYTNREALRGINGALVAQRYELEPHPVKRLTPKYFWYYWTGTGNRGNWGRNIIEHRTIPQPLKSVTSDQRSDSRDYTHNVSILMIITKNLINLGESCHHHNYYSQRTHPN